MFTKLLVIFIGIPLVEILILIKLGELFGFWSTFLLVIVTGFAGAAMARVQGFRAWQNIQSQLSQGAMPAEEMIDALLIFLAGVLLITPGLLTDMSGFVLLVPWSRFYFKRWLRRKFDDMIRRSREGGGPGGDIRFIIR
ncbi:MAG: FxsA family protein [Candidatus Omnitrophota bacterium]|nr:FxsA family protein [Candidatus Omnitrophota bacterium]